MYMKVNMIIAVEWTEVEKKNLKSFRVGRELNPALCDNRTQRSIH